MMPKLYAELSTWWHLLSPPDDYLDEAEFFRRVMVEAGLPVVEFRREQRRLEDAFVDVLDRRSAEHG